MTTTTTHGLPIPEETDKLGETDERIVELAEFLDEQLFDPNLYSGTSPAFTELDMQPIAPGGPSMMPQSAQLVVAGPLVQLTLTMTLDIGTTPLTVPTSGDVGNIPLQFKIGNPKYRPIVQVGGHSSHPGRTATFVLTAAGDILLASVAGSAALSSGDTLSAVFTYLRRP